MRQTRFITLLDLYLDGQFMRGHLSDELLLALRDFMASSFMDTEDKLLGHHFIDKRYFGKVTTSFTEAENSALKGHGY